MKFVVWGTGTRGKALYEKFNNEIVAFIDNDTDKVGGRFFDKDIINLEKYKKFYSNYFILISTIRPDWSEKIVKQLRGEKIEQYFLLSECPSELQVPLERYKLWYGYIADRKDDKSKCYGIYGCSFYSLFLYSYMLRLGWRNLWLIMPEDAGSEKILKIKELLPGVRLYEKDSRIKLCKIFKATRNYDSKLKEIEKEVEIEEFFEFTFKISDYRNKKLKKYENIHEGRRCFIVATGPSLTVDDVNTICRHDEYAIGMNRLYLIFEDTVWRPQYWVCTDWRILQESINDIIKMEVENKFVSDCINQNLELNKAFHVFHTCSDLQTDFLPKFSNDITEVVYDSGTVTYSCIQLAAYMGFSEIILLGVDFSISGNYADKKNHFTDKYFDANSKTGYFIEEAQLKAYQSAKRYADEHGIKIYNATRGGALEVFPRVDFDSLFKGGSNESF